MEYVPSRENCFRWPVKDHILNYELEDNIAVTDLPPLMNEQHFGTNESQFTGLKQSYTSNVFEFVFLNVLVVIKFSLLKWLTYKRTFN